MELLTYGLLGLISQNVITSQSKNNINNANNANNANNTNNAKVDEIYNLRNYNIISKNDKINNDFNTLDDEKNFYNIHKNNNTLGVYDVKYLLENHNYKPNIDERNKNSVNNNNNVNKLNIMTGYTIENFESKTEIEPMFNNYNYMTNNYDIFNTDNMKTRIVVDNEQRNEKPFKPEMVGISGYGYNSDIRIIPKTVDNLRTTNNQKITYKQPIIYGNKTFQPNYDLKIDNNKNKLIINDTIKYSVVQNNVNKNKMQENIEIDFNNREMLKRELFGGIENNIKRYDINKQGNVKESEKISYNIEPTNIFNLIGKQQIYDKTELKKTLKELLNNKSSLENAVIKLLNTNNRVNMENTRLINKEVENNTDNYIISNTYNNLKINKINELRNTLRGMLEHIENVNYSSVQKIHYKDLETQIKSTLREITEKNENINKNMNTNTSIKINNINDLKLTLRQILNKIDLTNYKGNNVFIPIISELKLTMRNLLNKIDINNNFKSNKQDVKINNIDDIKTTLRQLNNKIDVINYKGGDNSYVNISDEIKNTLRELNNKLDVINYKGVEKSYLIILDEIKMTIRETLKNINNGNIFYNINNNLRPFDEIKTTLKELAIDEKVGNLYNNISNVNYTDFKNNTLLNYSKEILQVGRNPTTISTLIPNNTINMTLKEENIMQRDNYGFYRLDNNLNDNKKNI